MIAPIVPRGQTATRTVSPVISSMEEKAVWQNGSAVATVRRFPSLEIGTIWCSRTIVSGRSSARSREMESGSISRNGMPIVSARIHPRASWCRRLPSSAASSRGMPRMAASSRISFRSEDVT